MSLDAHQQYVARVEQARAFIRSLSMDALAIAQPLHVLGALVTAPNKSGPLEMRVTGIVPQDTEAAAVMFVGMLEHLNTLRPGIARRVVELWVEHHPNELGGVI